MNKERDFEEVFKNEQELCVYIPTLVEKGFDCKTLLSAD